MIVAKNIYKSFGDQEVLKDINLNIENNQAVTIIGPSGCGKSTLLRLLCGLESADSGKIVIDGQQLNSQNLQSIRNKIGFVFQNSALFDSMNVYDNVAFPLRERLKLPENLIKTIVAEKLEWVGLNYAAQQYPSELSGGMRKRVSIARALSAEPQILFYDEPTTGLDPLVSSNIENLIVKLQKDLSLTSIIVTHQFSTIERVSDKIMLVTSDKRLIDLGSKAEAYNSLFPEAHDFFGACKVYLETL